ncbi:FtsW/RodA/SpoVE family cell cycle protein [Facklamia miroungae]|uniref:Rod shape determining protein RodA n=1 Tax=Facklamia miroungae TaxID=120956 RepID=A0A1G7PTI1_9LACT|nr:FtsW/RodA/SpoVE family cell cycle protein [Facklamia miroungae]NKZ28821.1 rod shape-determining protein RodA [Facklamia miroungae]SDF89503.1 rod shape determining protein RodA [Facklamia miroungae]
MQINKRIANYQENRIDYGVILTVLLLCLMGLAIVYATTAMIASQGIGPTLQQALWYALGALVVIVVMQFDSEQYWKLSIYFYGLGILLLIMVLFFHDRQTAIMTGAKSWFKLGPLSFQPSELMKPALIIFLSRLVTEHNSQNQARTIRSDFMLIGKLLLASAPVLLLVQLQNDLGTNLVMLSIIGGLILLSGVSWKILLPAFSIALILGGGLILLAVIFPDALLEIGFKPYQLGRITTWLEPFSDTRGESYQLVQSILSIGSGQLFGKGFGISEVPVPVRESDFIFTTIGENFGFFGSAVILVIYFVLIYQMVQTCFETQNEYYTYISAGVISMILFHVLENVGMTIGLLPITGVPLPFISQGGSAILSNMIGVGLILSMRYHHRSYMFSSEDPYMYNDRSNY